MSTGSMPISGHPDLSEMRQRYAPSPRTSMVQLVSGLTMLAGLFVALAPWITGFSGVGTLAVNSLITGLAIALLALAFATAHDRTYGIAWTCPLLGVWAIVSVFVVSGSVLTLSSVLSLVIGGGVVVLTGLGAMAAMMFSPKAAETT
ncbi:SPW repeat-containing protein [Halopolyspora algeriensis]|uniref:SPW repeat-containing protein n=1 Tax=Halopolyspora algeriensis TaxID=1500506 RepID=A0A368VEH0_9ACTN|nr:SPW repeat protein [Halopolyspora algeriensis]RCW39526.1 SPW repeat-containing protein [Halopolyspora algeriensis]TQM56161.1 SPW repeat-containing protein [Halopolyspora algeriensis]